MLSVTPKRPRGEGIFRPPCPLSASHHQLAPRRRATDDPGGQHKEDAKCRTTSSRSTPPRRTRAVAGAKTSNTSSPKREACSTISGSTTRTPAHAYVLVKDGDIDGMIAKLNGHQVIRLWLEEELDSDCRRGRLDHTLEVEVARGRRSRVWPAASRSPATSASSGSCSIPIDSRVPAQPRRVTAVRRPPSGRTTASPSG